MRGPGRRRDLSEQIDEDEVPEKSQRIASVCIGYGASDKIGEVERPREYEDDLKVLAEEYRVRNDAGECFVHIRKKHSSNRDLRALSELTKGGKFHKITLQGNEAESILTNSADLAKIIEKA